MLSSVHLPRPYEMYETNPIRKMNETNPRRRITAVFRLIVYRGNGSSRLKLAEEGYEILLLLGSESCL